MLTGNAPVCRRLAANERELPWIGTTGIPRVFPIAFRPWSLTDAGQDRPICLKIPPPEFCLMSVERGSVVWVNGASR